MPHAWLIGGPAGIGKATLAYRMARFVLAHPDPAAPAVQARHARSRCRPTIRVARRIAGQGASRPAGARADRRRQRQAAHRHHGRRRAPHGRLLRLDRGRGRLARLHRRHRRRPETSAGANALLKVLEEPPPRSLLLLVSHAPGRLLPTIRSRCRRLMLRPLRRGRRRRARRPRRIGRRRRRSAARARPRRAADGSVARAHRAVRRTAARGARARASSCSAGCRRPIPARLHALGDSLDRGGARRRSTPSSTRCAAGCRRNSTREHAPSAVWCAWPRPGSAVNRAARDAEVYNLDRKPLGLHRVRLACRGRARLIPIQSRATARPATSTRGTG